ncbi:thioredoxin reductase TR1 (ISS), partial [Corchorus olitorius]
RLLPPVSQLPSVTASFNAKGAELPVLDVQSNLPALKSHARDLLIVTGKRMITR